MLSLTSRREHATFTGRRIRMQTQRRPFHETIMDAIAQVNSSDELNLIATLIMATKIPKGHNEITTAWNQRLQEMGRARHEDRGVPRDLLEQKQEAAQEGE